MAFKLLIALCSLCWIFSQSFELPFNRP